MLPDFDIIHTVSTGPELVPEQYRSSIRRQIEDEFGPRFKLPPDWFWGWSATKNEAAYSGTFPTRVKTWLWKEHQIKANEPVKRFLADLGEMVRRNLPSDTHLYFDLTKKIEWPAGEFADGDSCFLTYKKRALVDLLHYGGFALRRWRKMENKYSPGGRAWVIPCDFGWVVVNARDFGRDRLETYAEGLRLLVDGEVVELHDFNVSINGECPNYKSFYVDGSHGILVGSQEQIKHGADLTKVVWKGSP